jgi:ribosomal protein S27E
VNIEFVTEEFLSGSNVKCPKCGKETTLYVSPQTKPAPKVESANESQPPPTSPAPDSNSSKNLRVCKDCGKTISVHAESCPHCGATYKRKHGVFFYVFWGVVSLGVTLTILAVLFSVLIFGLPAFLQGRRIAQEHAATTETNSPTTEDNTPLTPSQNTQRNLQEAAQIKAEATALLASGRFLRLTDEIDESVAICAKPTPTQQDTTGLSLFIVIPKQGKPILVLVAEDVTGKDSNNERQAISGFDTVRCRIGTSVFSLKKQWSPGNVKINIGETRQGLHWIVPEDSAASDLLLHILNSDSPIKVEFTSSFMGGSSYTFTMTEKQIQAIKDVFTIYKSLPDAALQLEKITALGSK